MFTQSEFGILEKARETYGNQTQILVAMEELSELVCVLAKYARYDRHDVAIEKLREKVLDELADVAVVICHVKAIFEISDDATDNRASQKIQRLDRWMGSSESLEYSTVDREIEEIEGEDLVCIAPCPELEDDWGTNTAPCHTTRGKEQDFECPCGNKEVWRVVR